jgi:NADPH-dependent 2,4-dienoyl-CoA reductase/sulfur reductase-like enzyme
LSCNLYVPFKNNESLSRELQALFPRRAAVPDLKGVNQEGVFLIRNYADGVRINDSTITKSAHSCIIAGAGLIGLEMVEAFKKRGSPVRREVML